MKRFFYIIILIAGCKEAYNPHLKNAGYNYLVVEGNILTGDDSTHIHLTRTVDVSDTSVVQPELNATVKVESGNGEIYQLQEEGNGFYFSTPLSINPGENYRLHILTSNGKEYASDYVPVKQTPPIDSVSWKLDNDGGVAIYANTHDATGSTQYYRWEYAETWEHRAKYSSVLIYERPAFTTYVTGCPKNRYTAAGIPDISGNILIATSTGLSADVIHERPLITIPYGSPKIDRVYSILVKQYALTKEAYEYWDNLQKNTENLGSIFDPQPFADYGNMHCITDSSEPVLGYISACSASQQRIYIYWSQVQWPYFFPDCRDTIVVSSPDRYSFFRSLNFCRSLIIIRHRALLWAAHLNCVDCKWTGGGVYIKPPYMP